MGWKIQNKEFEKLPFKVKEAYQNFYGFVTALETASDEEVSVCKNVLIGLFKLGIGCNVYGRGISEGKDGIHYRRNPCRESQYKTLISVAEAEKKGSSDLLTAAKKMAHTCQKCPYR